jgi:hypothetical protein
MTGGSAVRGGGGMPQHIMASPVPVSAKGARWTWRAHHSFLPGHNITPPNPDTRQFAAVVTCDG